MDKHLMRGALRRALYDAIDEIEAAKDQLEGLEDDVDYCRDRLSEAERDLEAAQYNLSRLQARKHEYQEALKELGVE